MPTPVADLETQLAQVTDRLVEEYADVVPDETVRVMVAGAVEPMRSAPVRIFIPVLVFRAVRERLGRPTRRGGGTS